MDKLLLYHSNKNIYLIYSSVPCPFQEWCISEAVIMEGGSKVEVEEVEEVAVLVIILWPGPG